MKRFLVLLGAIGALGCGSSTEPTGLPTGIYDLKSIDGQFGGGKFDTTAHCGSTFGGVSYLQVNDARNASLSLSYWDYCTGDPNHPAIYKDAGTYTVSGNSVTLSFLRATAAYIGTVNVAHDTLDVLLPDVSNSPPGARTEHFLFVRQ